MRKATTRDKQLVTGILISAFTPLKGANSINFVVKQDEKRMERMKILMEYLFEKVIRSGDIFISDNNNACILLYYPHKEKASFKLIFLNLKLAFKCIGLERVFLILKRQRILQKYYPKGEQIRPVIMGVKVEFTGVGVGARLIREVKNTFKDNLLPVVTNAVSERNVQLYKNYGFRIIGKDSSLGFTIYFLRLN